MPETVNAGNEKRIFYSRDTVGLNIVTLLLVLVLPIGMVIGGIYIFPLLIGPIIIYFLFVEIKRFCDRSPQIIISDKGIETKKWGFLSWEKINKEQVIVRRRKSGKGLITYLEYDNPNGDTLQTDLSELKVNEQALASILHTYRIRSEKILQPN